MLWWAQLGAQGMTEMTDIAKPAWPAHPNGGTDWEAVFEDPDEGLIPMIGRAQTATALRQCTVLVIKQLHMRKNDPAIVANFIAQLDAMVPDDTPPGRLPKIRKAIAGVLRQIKNDRIAKAAKAAGAAPPFSEGDSDDRAAETAPHGDEEDRRRTADTDIPEFTLVEPKPSLYALVVGIALGTTAAAGALFYHFAAPREPANADANDLFVRQMESATAGQETKEHIFGGKITVGSMAGRRVVTAHGIPGGACQSVAWSLADRGNVMISGVMPKRVRQPILEELCTRRFMGATLVWIPRK